jgi:hypothetical protein
MSEEVRSDQIRSIIQAGSGNEAKSGENRPKENSLGPQSSFSRSHSLDKLRQIITTGASNDRRSSSKKCGASGQWPVASDQ